MEICHMFKFIKKTLSVVVLIFLLVAFADGCTSIENSSRSQNHALNFNQNQNQSQNLGYLTININGIKHIYYPTSSLTFINNSWWVDFKGNPNSNNNMFGLLLPNGLSANNSITIDSDSFVSGDFRQCMNYITNTCFMDYITKDGTTYYFGSIYDVKTSLQICDRSVSTIKIDQWDSNGGYAVGEVNGKIDFGYGNIANFTNGFFKIKIPLRVFYAIVTH